MKTAKLALSLICLALLLASCGGMNDADAIKIAKQAAMKSQSPPRIYSNGGIELIRYWPDQAESSQGHYNICGDTDPSIDASCTQPMTLTTSLASSSGYDVTFTISWPGKPPQQHSWLFHVSDDGKANFVKEEGDKLPEMPR